MQKKKKVDREALNSSLMRIPRMNVRTARALIDLGIREIYELSGRAPEVLFEEHKKKHPDASIEHLHCMRLAVYYSETPEPDPNRLYPEDWKD